MRRTIIKVFLLWDFDKEERWLNEMAARGLALVSVGYCNYTFEQGDPGAYTVRLELLDNLPTNPQSEQYIRFIEGSGAEYIGSLFRWVYFRRKRSLGEFDLYTDYDCRIRHLNRVLWFIGGVMPIMLVNSLHYMLDLLDSKPDAFHLSVGLFFTVFSVMAIYGFLRVCLMKRKLRREHMLYE